MMINGNEASMWIVYTKLNIIFIYEIIYDSVGENKTAALVYQALEPFKIQRYLSRKSCSIDRIEKNSRSSTVFPVHLNANRFFPVASINENV